MDIALRARGLARVPVALWRVWGTRRAARAAPARILMFHGTPRTEAVALERQLRYLARRFEVVGLEGIAGGRRGALALTFDDGLRSNVEVAYPILRRLGLPATFFVCPALIDERRWLWNHEARARLRSLGAGAADIDRLIEQMKRLDLATRRVVERRIEEDTPGYRPSDEEREAFDLASWEELRRLDPTLVTIGSHTLSHPILSSLTPAQAEEEICGSRELLEKRLGRRAELFCYPNGEINETALRLARRAYRLAVTGAQEDVRPGSDPLRLPRLAAPQGLLRLAWQLHP
ncbi:MAG TPA: polysaccharide deacetylase family protein [Burkholderiales bacterium]|nr:polysaccharide deacetylase family protein [Burkholderiales bacterium]